MDTARPLRELFDELATGGHAGRDAGDMLRDAGHGDLPPDLVGEAIVNYADTAGVEVAEQLEPFVTAATAGGELPDADSGIDLLAGAAAPGIDDADLAAAAEEVRDEELPADVAEFDLAFGAGSEAAGATTPDDVVIDDWSGTHAEPETPTEPGTNEPGTDEPTHDDVFTDPFDLDAATSQDPADGNTVDGDPAEG